jgi:uncharacterized membrane protein YphA (DoxX/SURF4 family)
MTSRSMVEVGRHPQFTGSPGAAEPAFGSWCLTPLMFEQSAASERNPLSDWILRIGVGVCFLLIGWGKFQGGTEWVEMFQQIGMGQWFRYFTGVVEALGGLLVLIPISATAGFALLAVTITGFIYGGLRDRILA